VADTQPAQLSYTLLDELGTKASSAFPLMIDPAMTVAQLVTATTAFADLLDAITGGAIISGSSSLLFGTLGAKDGTPAAGSRVEQTGVFNFNNAVTAYRFGEIAPSLADSKISGGTINLVDSDVSAFVTAMTAAITGGGVHTNTARQTLTSLRDAFLSFRKHRKQLTRSSLEEA
jgi:hypothetical protein